MNKVATFLPQELIQALGLDPSAFPVAGRPGSPGAFSLAYSAEPTFGAGTLFCFGYGLVYGFGAGRFYVLQSL